MSLLLIGVGLVGCALAGPAPEMELHLAASSSTIRSLPVPRRYAALSPPIPRRRPPDALVVRGLIAELAALDVEPGRQRTGEIGAGAVLLDRLPAELHDVPRGAARKTLFIRAVLPLIMNANRAISADRRALLAVMVRRDASQAADRAWLDRLARRYRVAGRDLDRLVRRVDTVPPSLALAQAAIESGWGGSRFTVLGNALFGQWTWKAGDGIAPLHRAKGAIHAVKAFRRLADSVAAYMLNLNRAGAYRRFRARRADLRRRGKPPSGLELAATLTLYSTERERYTAKLATIITQNRLLIFDTTAPG